MAQQQEIMCQYDLFNQMGQDIIRPFATSEAGMWSSSEKGLAIKRSR